MAFAVPLLVCVAERFFCFIQIPPTCSLCFFQPGCFFWPGRTPWSFACRLPRFMAAERCFFYAASMLLRKEMPSIGVFSCCSFVWWDYLNKSKCSEQQILSSAWFWAFFSAFRIFASYCFFRAVWLSFIMLFSTKKCCPSSLLSYARTYFSVVSSPR